MWGVPQLHSSSATSLKCLCTHFGHVTKIKFNIHLRIIEQSNRLSDHVFFLKTTSKSHMKYVMGMGLIRQSFCMKKNCDTALMKSVTIKKQCVLILVKNWQALQVANKGVTFIFNIYSIKLRKRNTSCRDGLKISCSFQFVPCISTNFWGRF